MRSTWSWVLRNLVVARRHSLGMIVLGSVILALNLIAFVVMVFLFVMILGASWKGENTLIGVFSVIGSAAVLVQFLGLLPLSLHYYFRVRSVPAELPNWVLISSLLGVAAAIACFLGLIVIGAARGWPATRADGFQ